MKQSKKSQKKSKPFLYPVEGCRIGWPGSQLSPHPKLLKKCGKTSVWILPAESSQKEKNRKI